MRDIQAAQVRIDNKTPIQNIEVKETHQEFTPLTHTKDYTRDLDSISTHTFIE